MRREHAEHIARIEASTIELQRSLEQKLQETKQAVMREHAEEIEKLRTQLQAMHRRAQHAEQSCYKLDDKLAIANANVRMHFRTAEELSKQAERYEKLRRLNWYQLLSLSKEMRHSETVLSLDALVDQLPASGEASEEEQHGRVE